MEDCNFCPECMVEGAENCETHGEANDIRPRSDIEDDWHDEWERDNFGDN